uniref:Morc S5 domain-containing protein n=1 Tax=Leersia perrieri TaxID=77586 RepID=A0A0D9XRV2_9ORYZ
MGSEQEDTKPFLSAAIAIPRANRGSGSCHQHLTTAKQAGGDRIRSRPAAPRRISRSFWSADEYDEAGSSSSGQQLAGNVQNHMRVHPKFLHSNATSHKWPFGAVAELLDNAVDEIKTGATRIIVDKAFTNCNGSPGLLVQDDGGGMDPESLRRCMSFGFSEKQSGSSIGQYGNGFKTSTMRLGADVIVFSRCMKRSEPTQSIGLLSYTFLRETGQKDVVVPVVDYKYNLVTGEAKQCHRLAPDKFSSNLSVILKWSPFATEEQLLQNFCDIGPHGTKIVIFKLWLNDDGDLELDFNSDEKDILISGVLKPAETSNTAKTMNGRHLANQLRYSLRAYVSILYLKLPAYFKIILRGQEVKHHHIASDLRYCQCIRYMPQTFGKKEDHVDTIIGFLDGAPTISIHGFSIYHKNRLILPFQRVLSNASSKGRGVAGVLEADFIKPTHDKQDFEKSQLYQKLINRLKEMTNEYWDLHSDLVGYQKVSTASPALVPTLSGTTATTSSERIPIDHVSAVPSRPNSRENPSHAIPIAFAPHLVSAPSGPNAVATGVSTVCSQSRMQIRSPSTVAIGTGSADTRKRKMETLVDMDGPLRRQSRHDLAGKSSVDSIDQVCQHMGERELKEYTYLKQENKLLRQECLDFESAEKDLLLKEQKLRLEIEQADAQYTSLLNEYISVISVKTSK